MPSDLPLCHICSQRMGKVQIDRHSLIHYQIAMLFYSFVGMVEESSYTMHVVWKVIWHLLQRHCQETLQAISNLSKPYLTPDL